MAKSKTKRSLKRPAKTIPSPSALPVDFGTAVREVGEALDELRHLEQVSDNLGDLGGLHDIAMAIAGYTIAQYGGEEDRAKIVEYFKGWFWKSEIFKDN